MSVSQVRDLERQVAERDAQIARQTVVIAYLEELARQLRVSHDTQTAANGDTHITIPLSQYTDP